jgi:hypothetical protein
MIDEEGGAPAVENVLARIRTARLLLLADRATFCPVSKGNPGTARILACTIHGTSRHNGIS